MNELERMASLLGLAPRLSTLCEPSHDAIGDLDDAILTMAGTDSLTLKLRQPLYGDGFLSRLQLQLPSQAFTRVLILFALDQLGWLIPVVPKTFLDRHDILWQKGAMDIAHLASTKPALCSLYFAMLSAALLYMKAEQPAQQGISPDVKRLLARSYFDGALELLHKADWMRTPSLVCLQAFCFLAILFEPFELQSLHDTMLASMIRVAHLLGIHNLGRKVEQTPAAEIARRIYTFLFVREVLCATEGSRFAVHGFGSVVSANWNATPKPSPPLSRSQPLAIRPTETSYLTAQTRLALLFRDVSMHSYTTRNSASTPSTYAAILGFDDKLLCIFDDMPFLQDDWRASVDDPRWLPAARNILTLTILHKRLLLHRRYFALSFTDLAYTHSRTISIAVAYAVLAHKQNSEFYFDDKLDVFMHALPAAMVLLLDVLFPLPTSENNATVLLHRCQHVEGFIQPIRADPSNKRATAALKRIDDLLVAAKDRVQQTSPIHNVDMFAFDDEGFGLAPEALNETLESFGFDFDTANSMLWPQDYVFGTPSSFSDFSSAFQLSPVI